MLVKFNSFARLLLINIQILLLFSNRNINIPYCYPPSIAENGARFVLAVGLSVFLRLSSKIRNFCHTERRKKILKQHLTLLNFFRQRQRTHRATFKYCTSIFSNSRSPTHIRVSNSFFSKGVWSERNL